MIQLEEIGDFSTYFNFHCDIEKMEEIGGIRHSASQSATRMHGKNALRLVVTKNKARLASRSIRRYKRFFCFRKKMNKSETYTWSYACFQEKIGIF